VPEPLITTRPGGERIVTDRLRGVRSVALGLWIATGSRDEPRSRAGVSHFIEHLLFKGSSRYTAQGIAELFDTMGGELNAATSRETTVLYTRVPDGHLPEALDAMADMVFAPTFADVDSEREVVLEEIAMVDDNPQDLVHDLAAEAVFGGHPLGRPVIGSADVIAGVSPRALREWHRRAYAGPRIVLAAAGNVSHERLVELFAGRRPALDGTRQAPRRAPMNRLPRPGYRFLRRRTEQYHVVLAAPGIARDDETRYAVSLLDAILGGSASSRLFQEIRELRGMAYSVYTFGSQYAETGQVGIYVGTREDNVVEALGVIGAELARVRDERVGEDELRRAREHVKGRLALSMESTGARMNRLGRSVLMGTPLLTLDETIERLQAVTREDLERLAGELYPTSGMSVAAIGRDEDLFRGALAPVSAELAAA
jgi:predicted Zn-dependent peptidase